MDTRARDEDGLELSDVDVEGIIETEGGSEGGGHLSDGTVEVGEDRALNVEGASAHVVDGLEERVGGEHDDSGSDLRRKVDGGEAPERWDG